MEVLVGPTFSIEASPCTSPSSQSQGKRAGNCIFLKDEEQISGRIGLGIEEDISSDSSSSIGAPDDSDDEDEEVDSGSGALNSLDSLEDSLPNKRGLSNHFAGKSKSFTNLSEVTSNNCSSVKDLVKPENPFNKRRRILMANRWRKSSFYSWSNPKSMPLLALAEDEPYDDDDHRCKQDDEEENQSSSSSTEQLDRLHQTLPKFSSNKLQDRKFKASFKSHSCFNLTDLREEDDYDDDEQFL